MTPSIFLTALVGLALGFAAGTPATAQDLQQKLAAAKLNAATNQQALRSHGWIEKVELSLKGEVKNTTVNSCRYGADGKVVKTVVVEPPPAEKKRGLRGKVIEKKKGDPESPVTLKVGLQSLPGGPSYPGNVVLSMPASNVEVRITNSSYQKLAQ